MSNAEKHWEKTRSLLFVTLAIWFVFSIGIFLFAAEMNELLDLSDIHGHIGLRVKDLLEFL